jgi:hypothetical protein
MESENTRNISAWQAEPFALPAGGRPAVAGRPVILLHDHHHRPNNLMSTIHNRMPVILPDQPIRSGLPRRPDPTQLMDFLPYLTGR